MKNLRDVHKYILNHGLMEEIVTMGLGQYSTWMLREVNIIVIGYFSVSHRTVFVFIMTTVM